MGDIIEYKGYYSRIEYSAEDNVLFGKIEGINDLVTFESDSSETIKKEFHNAVDDYLEFCKKINQEPDKTYSGSFNIRITPSLHKKLAVEAFKNHTSINRTVEAAIVEYLNNDTKEKLNKLWDLYNYSTGFVHASTMAANSFATANWNGGLVYAG